MLCSLNFLPGEDNKKLTLKRLEQKVHSVDLKIVRFGSSVLHLRREIITDSFFHLKEGFTSILLN